MDKDLLKLHKKIDKIQKELSDDKKLTSQLEDIKKSIFDLSKKMDTRFMKIEREVKRLKK